VTGFPDSPISICEVIAILDILLVIPRINNRGELGNTPQRPGYTSLCHSDFKCGTYKTVKTRFLRLAGVLSAGEGGVRNRLPGRAHRRIQVLQ